MVRSKKSMESWSCAVCGNKPPEVAPYFQVRNGTRYYLDLCKPCDNKRRLKYKRQKNSPAVRARHATSKKAFLRNANPEQRAVLIIQSSTRADKAKGRATSLTVDFIVSLITQPCRYCGDTQARMTLDRIDNAVGHIESNVLPSCLRCNVVCGAMPYPAWLLISQNMQKARETGLFGGWDGKTDGNKKDQKEAA
jgi:hypothetical protein